MDCPASVASGACLSYRYLKSTHTVTVRMDHGATVSAECDYALIKILEPDPFATALGNKIIQKYDATFLIYALDCFGS
jgi:hypothetical protein